MCYYYRTDGLSHSSNGACLIVTVQGSATRKNNMELYKGVKRKDTLIKKIK